VDLKRGWQHLLIMPLFLLALWEPLVLAALELLDLVKLAPVITIVIILAVSCAVVQNYGPLKMRLWSLVLLVGMVLTATVIIIPLAGNLSDAGEGFRENWLPIRLVVTFGLLSALWYGIYTSSTAMLDSGLALCYMAACLILLMMFVFLTGRPLTGYVLAFAAAGLILLGYLRFSGAGFLQAGMVGGWLFWTAGLTAVILTSAWVLSGFWRIPSLGLNSHIIDGLRGQTNFGGPVTSYNTLTNFEVGGDLYPDNRLFMTVKSPVPSYWRGESFDHYTTTGWEKTLSIMGQEDTLSPIGGNWADQSQGRFVEQVFTLAGGTLTNIIFTGYQPVSVNLPTEYYIIDEAFNLYLENPFPAGASYRVKTLLPGYTSRDLRNSKEKADHDFLRVYLQVPEELPQRVRSLALRLTEGKDNPYDKAKAIEKYLRDNYPYTLHTEPTPEGRDLVDYFLYDLKKGYCTYHASAMTVMMRSLGIPARWVTGFVTGAWNEEIKAYEVRNSDAHAWVEVYFDDYGWVPFEPTSSFALPGEAKMDHRAKEMEQVQKENLVEKGTRVEPRKDGEKGYYFQVAGAAGVLCCFWLAKRFRRRRQGKDKQDYSALQNIYLRMLKALESKGYRKQESQTPREYAWSLEDKLPGQMEFILRVTEEYLANRYGGRGHGEEEIAALEEVVATLEKDL